MGWIPDLPDPRDLPHRHPAIVELLEQLPRNRRKTLPDDVDLSGDGEVHFIGDVREQGALNSSTAFAVLGLVEYFERRVHGRIFTPSHLFLYKVTRNLMQQRPQRIGDSAATTHSTGDTGADLRTTLKALSTFGVPPETAWPYDISRFDEEPTPFVYTIARRFAEQQLAGLRYFRIDTSDMKPDEAWNTVRSFLAAGFPLAFGFSVPSSMQTEGTIPGDPSNDRILGGQAALAIGYTQHHQKRNSPALLIRTSWGSAWGDHGKGWLPAEWIQIRSARDFWTILDEQWFACGELSRPTKAASRECSTS